jgi:hypothetical protein
MHAITLRQPWAFAVMMGAKAIENRTWNTSHRGPLVIHAGRSVEHHLVDDVLARVAAARHLQHGRVRQLWRDYCVSGFVATATLHGVTRESEDPWFAGPYGWLLKDLRPIRPVQARGRQGIFLLTQPEARAVRTQLSSPPPELR